MEIIARISRRPSRRNEAPSSDTDSEYGSDEEWGPTPSVAGVRRHLPEVRRRLAAARASDGADPLDRMASAFGPGDDAWSTAVLRRQQAADSNLPVYQEPDPPGLFFPGLVDAPWADVAETLPWTQRLRGEAVLGPVRAELEALVARSARASGRAAARDDAKARGLGTCGSGPCCFPLAAAADDQERCRTAGADADAPEPVFSRYDETYGEHGRLASRAGAWSALFLVDDGRVNEAAAAALPATMALLRSIPGRTGDAFFSCLEPGSRIALHRGPTNTKLTCHLGIVVPDGDCRLRVGTEARGWAEGEWLAFNDSFPHEVWHRGASRRIVLIVDVWNPAVTVAERRALRLIGRAAEDEAEARASPLGRASDAAARIAEGFADLVAPAVEGAGACLRLAWRVAGPHDGQRARLLDGGRRASVPGAGTCRGADAGAREAKGGFEAR
jgi:hypothetical protein